MGALEGIGHGRPKNKASRGGLGTRRSGFGPYGRGNFPGHHVLGSLAKNGADECKWLKNGLDGCK